MDSACRVTAWRAGDLRVRTRSGGKDLPNGRILGTRQLDLNREYGRRPVCCLLLTSPLTQHTVNRPLIQFFGHEAFRLCAYPNDGIIRSLDLLLYGADSVQ